jgi:3-oxoacyl-[acyl-carrier protein] reductase
VLAPVRAELELSDPASIARYIRDPEHVAIDALINNAGVNPILSIADLEQRAFEATLAVNVTAPLLLIKAVTPHMASRGWGRIVSVSSIYSLIGRNGRAAYSSSKAALNALTRAAAIEYGSSNILVNAALPGFVETDLTRANNTTAQIAELAAAVPLGRLADPAEIAPLVYFLGSEQNTYISGQTVVIDGGFTCK